MSSSAGRRIPRAHLDPILSAQDALAVFGLQISHPLTDETLVMLIDQNCCGGSLITVSATADREAVLRVAETLTMALALHGGFGFVIASVRPGGGLLLDDDELWLELEDTADLAGLILFDWLVIGSQGTHSVPQEFGMSTRWPAAQRR